MWILVTYKLLTLVVAEVEDVASGRSFADGGAFLTLPMFYLEGENPGSSFKDFIVFSLCASFVVFV